MKKLLKSTTLLLIAKFLSFSSCKKKDENPISGNCHISVTSSYQLTDTTIYDNNLRPIRYVYFDTHHSYTPFLSNMSFEYNSSNQIIKSTIIFFTGEIYINLYKYDNQNKLSQFISLPGGLQKGQNDTTYYDYDLKTNKVIKERKSSGSYVRYEYDSNGNNIIKSYVVYTKNGIEQLDTEYLKFDDKNNPYANNPVGYELSFHVGLAEYSNKNNVLESKYYVYGIVSSDYVSTYEYNGLGFPTKIFNTISYYDSQGKPTGFTPFTETVAIKYICK